VKLPGSLALRVGRRLPPSARRLVNLARGIDMPALVDRPPASSVAVLAPHPDDEVLGCGGTIQKHLAAGEQVRVVLLTSGERTASFTGQGTASSRSQREAEAVAAAADLGLGEDDLDFLHLPDGGVGPDGAAALRDALRRSGADLVYAPNPVDAHRDHVATARLLGDVLDDLTAVRRVALYEVWTPVHPNTVVDVTAQLETSVRAIERYASATAVVDYVHTLRGLAAYRSGHGLHGRGYAEAFLVLERAPFLGLLAALD
jgi:LmbE family N-acetylglucosaminyl deacetylase